MDFTEFSSKRVSNKYSFVKKPFMKLLNRKGLEE